MTTDRLRQLVEQGRDAEAETEARELIRTGRPSAIAFAAIAAAARRKGRFEEAISALREAAALDPDAPLPWLQLGELLALCARWNEALRALRRSRDLAPRDVAAWVALAGAELASGRTEEAESTAARLMEHFPAAPASHLLAAALHRTRGRRDAATAAYRRTLELDEDNAAALLGLAELEPRAAGLIDGVARARAAEGRALDERVQIEFALARLLDAAGRTEEAFASFATANALHRQSLDERGIRCRPDEMTAWAPTAATRLTATAFAGAPPFPDADVVPIFILGMPRSGTTLVERILARHPRVAPGGEMTVGQAAHAEYLRARARSGLPWPVDPALPEERRLLADARERYAEQALRHAGDARHVTDKHPANALIAGFLRLIFPEAPMVHVVREPMAACWSIFTAFLPAASACFTSLEDIARYRAAHFDLVRLWSSRFDLAELSYEALVTDPAASIRSLLAACRLPWSQACLRPEEAAEPVTTASVDQVRSPIHRDSVDRHARYAPYLGTLRLALGLPAAEAPATK